MAKLLRHFYGQIDLLPVDIWLVHVGTIDKKQSDNDLVVVQHRLRQNTMTERGGNITVEKKLGDVIIA